MMRFYFLTTLAMMSVVCADSRSSFFSEIGTVSSFLRADTYDHFSEALTGSACQNDDVTSLHRSEEAAVSSETQQVDKTVVSKVAKESWWSYSKRMVWGAADVAYQYLRSNRLTGVESGTCQSWTSLTKLKDVQANWRVNSRQQFLLGKNGESAISTQICDEVISEGYESLALKGALEKANKIQRQAKVQKVYLPLNLNLTNYVTDEQIMHRVTMEVVYNDAGIPTSLKILDPQLGFSGSYLSNAKALCEEAFKGLKSGGLVTEYTPVGIQLPGTGNCQKMAAYIAVALGEGQTVEDLILKKANAFCTQLHNTDSSEDVSSSKPSGFWGKLPRLW